MGAACLAAILAAAPASAQRTKVTVYTAIENEQLAPYKQAFEADNPDVEIQWVRDSTGVITARFLAEKDNPRADIIWGLSASSVVLFETMGLLEPTRRKGRRAEARVPRHDRADLLVGHGRLSRGDLLQQRRRRKGWRENPSRMGRSHKPEFKGKVVMPHPASSGTGYLAVAGWIQSMGEQKAWEFMDKLHDNIAVYTHSGSAPCVQAARGERLAGIGFDMRGAVEKTKGAPLDLVAPTDGVGWDLEATGIVKGTKNLAAAQKLADFAVTKKANETLYAKYYALVAFPDVKAAPPNYPTEGEGRMVKNDFGWMAKERERILAEWSKRYESKAAPK